MEPELAAALDNVNKNLIGVNFGAESTDLEKYILHGYRMAQQWDSVGAAVTQLRQNLETMARMQRDLAELQADTHNILSQFESFSN